MSYCTLQNLTDRYGERLLVEISDRGESASDTIDEALISRAIADADALIDGYLAARYKLPLSTTPAIVTDLSQAIAIYKAQARVADEKIAEDYRTALKTLRDIANGLVKLDVDGVEPAASGASEVRTNNPERPLSAATMKGYI
jgi:phage gp36-like protein